MIERSQKALLAKRIEEEPRRFIQVVAGPRQVGKTTLVRQFIEQCRIPVHFAAADLVPAGQSSWISQQWEAARFKLSLTEAQEALLVIDEIQKIGNWSETVKKEWDADSASERNLKVIILGSSRLLLQQGLTESLAGRFEIIPLGHWSYSEMHQAFDFTPEQYVWFGGYPGAASLVDDEARWARYITDSLVETSISKDILMLTRVDKPALMKRLFELGCSYSGQMLSYTKMLGQLQDAGNTTTLAHYLNLLDTAGLLAGLEKFSNQEVRTKASSPKFQVYNMALQSAQQPLTFGQVRQNPELWGRWVESAIGAHLLNHARTGPLKLFYWRQGNHEVDFVLEYRNEIIGLEIKSSRSRALAGMDMFQRLFDPKKVLLVGNSGIPWQDFMQIDPLELFR
jgi:hypothetical protein